MAHHRQLWWWTSRAEHPWYGEESCRGIGARRLLEHGLAGQRRRGGIGAHPGFAGECAVIGGGAGGIDALDLRGVVQDRGQLSSEPFDFAFVEIEPRERGNAADVGGSQ